VIGERDAGWLDYDNFILHHDICVGKNGFYYSYTIIFTLLDDHIKHSTVPHERYLEYCYFELDTDRGFIVRQPLDYSPAKFEFFIVSNVK
jgi:hypothetical protein